MALELLVVLVLVLLNGVLSMAETAVVSARKIRLHQRADEGDERAAAALALAESPAAFLSTVQVGITLIGIGAGVFGGATMADELGALLAPLPRSEVWARPAAYGLIISIITVLSLVLGELVPKRIALSRPERIASAMARPMQRLARLVGPFEKVLTAASELVLKLLRIRPGEEPPVTEEEVRVLIEKGTEAGIFERHEHEMLEAVFDLGERRLASLMTPRPEVAWLDVRDGAEETARRIAERPRARYPVGDGSLDELVGVVLGSEALARVLSGAPLDLRALARPPLVLPETVTAVRALERLRKGDGAGLAVVVDEHGTVAGVLTLTDVVAAVVGELPALRGSEPSARMREDGSWLLDGRLPVERLEDLDEALVPPADERGDYETVAGFVMARLGRLPREGDRVTSAGWTIEVVDMDGRRVDKVLASRDR